MTDDQELNTIEATLHPRDLEPTEPGADMTDEEFEQYVASLPKLSNSQVNRYMKLMNRHKPVNEAVKAKRKVTNRAKNKVARKQRKANRK